MVCAVIVAGAGSSPVLAAVRASTPAVDTIVLAGPDALRLAADGDVAVAVDAALGPAGALAAGVDAALAADADWIWALDGHAVPAPDALEALLDAREPVGLPPGALLAAKITDTTGELHPDALPWPEIFEKEISTAACGHGLVSLRAARAGAVLVSGAAVRSHGGPRPELFSHGETLEWTARILRDEDGYLVPSAVATRAGREPRALRRALRNRAGMLRGDAWKPEEKLWFGFLLVQDVVATVTRRR